MEFTRKASAIWKGSGKEGKGSLTTDSKALKDTPYTFKTRFEEVVGTNPEELIAAAHSGCFTMKLSFLLGEAGHTPEKLHTEAQVTLKDGGITLIHLKLKGVVDGIGQDEFQEIAQKAKETCPVSKVLKTKITLEAELA